MTQSSVAKALLSIDNLHISVEDKDVVRGVSLTIHEGEVHAIMGPNGSGKSSLVNALMGHPKYKVLSGEVRFRGQDLLSMEPHERAQAGLFLAFQYPKEIAGVTLRSFLFAAHKAVAISRGEKPLSIVKFKGFLEEKMKTLSMDAAFAERSLNQGFSGGEKKKAEVLQMSILGPRLALLDETDSGLDVDALRIVATGINAIRHANHPLPVTSNQLRVAGDLLLEEAKEAVSPSFLIVTHYARILDTITPDHVHVMVRGQIIKSGDAAFAKTLEKEGYGKFVVSENSASISLNIE